ncbi:MLP-like protein 43 [Carya illinoinensis]|uniref:MLP-like protein 43 n=1 Tax=Carya illinoinensis TaxID=32201 RepID=UPI001C71BAEC|nr:MLP-like protein 43 [Carya illinoinensis]
MSSSLSAKLSIEIEAKSPARAMYEACAKRMYEIPKLCPSYIPKVDLVEGNWEDVGAVVNWRLVYGPVSTGMDFYKRLCDVSVIRRFQISGGLYVVRIYVVNSKWWDGARLCLS